MIFENHLYISYAHLDNVQGWVNRFHENLDTVLRMRLGRAARIWRDNKLAGNDLFRDELFSQISSSALFLAIISPRYLESEWTQQELAEFIKVTEKTGGVAVDNRSRVIQVLLSPVEQDDFLHPLFRDTLVCEFYTFEENGRPIQLDLNFGGQYEQDYLRKLNTLVYDITEILKSLEADGDEDSSPPKPERPRGQSKRKESAPMEQKEPNSVAPEAEAPVAEEEPDSVAPEAEVTVEPYAPPSAGYISDTVDSKAPDRLGIDKEVSAICRVLASRQVKSPLSLGLFGDWGSGKSFFMKKMQQAILDIAEAAREQAEQAENGEQPAFCTSVVQIEFNAWHFSDANLWASLVSHIFDELFEKLSKTDSEETIKNRLKNELKQAKGLVQEATQALSHAKSGVEKAEQALQEARKDREDKEQTLHDVLNNVGALLKIDMTVQEELNKAGEALGYPEVAATYATLQETTGALRSFSKRTAAIGQLFIRSPFTFVAIPFLIVVLLLPLVVEYLLEAFPPTFAWVNAGIAKVSTFVTGVIVWVGTQIRRAAPLMQKIEDAYKKAREERKRLQREKAAPQQRALDLAREREQATRQTLQEAQVNLQKIEHELGEFSPVRQLYRLIEERGLDDEYSRHLGIISLIRKDFEQMSKLIHDLGDQELQPGEEPPIQRIILYIDDLDRCRPQRVVEVLEAIHLLLAFPLFVVVVGVDPRWLRRCLALRYRHLLSPSENHAEEPEPDAASLHTSTPQDYLEKIFQIPFALRPIEPEGFQGLMKDLLQPLPPPTTLQDVTPKAPVAAGSDAPDLTDEELAKLKAAIDQAKTEDAGQARVTLNPEQLEFTDWEKQDMDLLAPLFRAPRAVKRFVNIYRLLRVGLDPEELAKSEEQPSKFEGSAGQPGEYRVVLVLLAVVTGFPNLAPRFLRRLHLWLPLENPPAGWCSWDLFLNTLDLPFKNVEQAVARAVETGNWDELQGLQSAGGDEANNGPDAANDEPYHADELDAAWKDLSDRLRTVAGKKEDKSFLPFEESVLKKWALRVARYSFSFNLREVI